MSGKPEGGPARIPAKRHATNDAAIGSPWFGPARLGGRPWILTFVGTEKSFVELLFEGVAKSIGGFVPGAFPRILAMRDFAEPPRALIDGSGAPAYVRGHVEPTPAERPTVGELEPDDDDPSATTLAELLPSDALPPASDAGHAAWLRKLYLPMHQHFHVVACQLDCKRPGLPRIDPKRVIEAGMVVRRFIPDPKATRPRWEDWIPSPHGNGIWAEIAKEDMTTIAGTARAIDPKALPPDVLDVEQLQRLGVDAGAKVTLKLSTSTLQAFPATAGDVPLGEAAKHTARWGFVPVASSEKERELPEQAEDLAKIAKGFADVAAAHLTERVVDHAAEIRTRIRDAMLPLLTRFRDALPPRPTDVERDIARQNIVLATGASDGDVDTAASEIGMAALPLFADRILDPPNASNRWNAAVVATRNGAAASSPLQPPLPGWVTSSPLVAESDVAVLTRRLVWDAFDTTLPAPDTFADNVDLRIRCAVLLWVRRQRIRLLTATGAFYDVLFTGGAKHPDPDEIIRDPLDPQVLLRAPISVGALGEEIAGWIAANDDRNKTPVSWDAPILSAEGVEVHTLALTLEEALADVDGQGSGAGSAYAAVLDVRTQQTAKALVQAIGAPTPRERGIDLSAQPDRGLLVFPGPSPTSASLAALESEVLIHYENYGQPPSGPDAPKPFTTDELRSEAKARRHVTRGRYDADHLYAVCCYARVAGLDSCDEPQLVWSRRTDTFLVAEPMDLLGLKPVAFQLPDLPKLLRDIPRLRKARALPFASITTPQNSGIATGDDPTKSAREWGIAWICSFGIPLFTISAWIAFKIIFSVLIVIPGFAWMLLLKICVPVPSPKKS